MSGAWIACAERLPPQGEEVLTACAGTRVVDIEILVDCGKMGLMWAHDEGSSPLSTVTYWQPLPKPPGHDVTLARYQEAAERAEELRDEMDSLWLLLTPEQRATLDKESPR